MAVRRILHYPDRRLRERARPVPSLTREVEQLIEDMAETMYAAPGVGLAAPQIGEPVQVFVIDVAPDGEPSDLRVFLNPEIVERQGSLKYEEGCLSFPGVREDVIRAEKVKVRARGQKWELFELEAEGLLAIAIQHEYDHLNGVLMIDHLGPLKKRLVHRRMQKRGDATASL